MTALTRAGFVVEEVREVLLTRAEARSFYEEHVGAPWFSDHLNFMTSAPVVFLAMTAPEAHRASKDAVELLRELLGPTDPAAARERAPGSIRARFGTDLPLNAMHGSADAASARRELGLLREFLAARGES